MKKENHLQACLRKGYVSSQTGMFIERWVQTHHFFPCFRLHVFFASDSVSFSCPVSLLPNTTSSQHSKGLVLATCISWLHWHVHQFDARTSQRSWIRRCSDVEEPLNWRCFGCKIQSSFRKSTSAARYWNGFFLAVFCSWKRIWQVSKLRKTQQGSDSHIYDSYPSDRPSAPRHT